MKVGDLKGLPAFANIVLCCFTLGYNPILQFWSVNSWESQALISYLKQFGKNYMTLNSYELYTI